MPRQRHVPAIQALPPQVQPAEQNVDVPVSQTTVELTKVPVECVAALVPQIMGNLWQMCSPVHGRVRRQEEFVEVIQLIPQELVVDLMFPVPQFSDKLWKFYIPQERVQLQRGAHRCVPGTTDHGEKLEVIQLAVVSGPRGALDASITSARLHQTC